MAAPNPPQGNQTQQTERPLRVYAEQYTAGGALPVGVVVIDPNQTDPPPLFIDGLPRAYLPLGPKVVQPGDWVISNRYTGALMEVIGPEEFAERFGGGGPPV